ncbi:MAG: RNA polymerase sigma factor [Planctomycetota bacterium]|jgi:RNA polymerase sigma-70 factor (ECF subfamily)
MPIPEYDPTSWQLILDAGGRCADRRSEFANRYGAVVRAYLEARWGGRGRRGAIDDALQNVFVECFRRGGVLERVRADRPDSFRAFLLGVTRNVALRTEQRDGGRGEQRLDTEVMRGEAGPGALEPEQAFERRWARAMIAEALQATVARHPEDRTAELFELRFEQGLPIREIAGRWGCEAEELHRLYARARRRFGVCLRQVVAQHEACSEQQLDGECARLLALLQ